jgi:hypothetical protein
VAKSRASQIKHELLFGYSHISRPSKFTLRKCVELTPATRKKMEGNIPAVVHIIFKIKYLYYFTKQTIPSQQISSKIN